MVAELSNEMVQPLKFKLGVTRPPLEVTGGGSRPPLTC
jgi:hypothetical protein